jgi:hypothetical protein
LLKVALSTIKQTWCLGRSNFPLIAFWYRIWHFRILFLLKKSNYCTAVPLL